MARETTNTHLPQHSNACPYMYIFVSGFLQKGDGGVKTVPHFTSFHYCFLKLVRCYRF